MALRVTASNKNYQIINELWSLYAITKNPHLWTSPDPESPRSSDLDFWQYDQIVETLESYMQLLLDGVHPSLIEKLKEIALDNGIDKNNIV